MTRQRLQAIIEEYETGQEEMRASNEEMQSTNEELRSTMEELETSKEELQSINEELQTVNQENRHKVDELAQLSGDLQNLLTATNIATLFLDRQSRILRFTPQVGELFNIRVTDRGRPISDLTHRLGYDELQDDAKQVIDRLTPIEREVVDESGRWYLTRVMPYRSTADRIEGRCHHLRGDHQPQGERGSSTAPERAEPCGRTGFAHRLHELSMKLIDGGGTPILYEQILDVAMAIMHADFASIQMFAAGAEPSNAEDALHLLAWRGFHPKSAEFWQRVELHSASSRAGVLRRGKRGIIADIEQSDLLKGTQDLEEYRRSGIRVRAVDAADVAVGPPPGRHLDALARAPSADRPRAPLLRRPGTSGGRRRRTGAGRGVTPLSHPSNSEDALQPVAAGRLCHRRRLSDSGSESAAAPLFGGIEGEVIGRDFGEVVHTLWEHDSADEIVRIFRHTLETGEPYFTPERAESRIDLGITEHYEWRVDRITLPSGQNGVVCYFREISGQVLARNEIEKSREALRQADRRKDEFLATLAHELRNPLAPILAGLELLKLDKGNPAILEETRSTMERQAQQLVMLVDDLPDVSRITSGTLKLRKSRVNVREIVENAVAASRPSIDKAGTGIDG